MYEPSSPYCLGKMWAQQSLRRINPHERETLGLIGLCREDGTNRLLGYMLARDERCLNL